MRPRVLILCVLAIACSGSDRGGDAGVAALTALFELPRGAPLSEFYALPYPNDLRRKPDGSLDLDDHPAPSDFVRGWLDAIATRTHGFGTNAPIYVRFSAAIDPASLPVTGLEEDASVYLVDVDPASPSLGRRAPLRFHFSADPLGTIGPNWLACQPYPGFPLRPLTTYALVVTRRLRDPGGARAERSADFEAVMAGGGDAAVTRARTAYAPLRAWLDGGGAPPADVVAAAVFTTQDPTSLVSRLRAAAVALPAPVARGVEKKASPSALFDLFEGRYDAPGFQTGEPPYLTTGGEILLDEAGLPIVQRTEEMRFALTVPTGAVPAGGWPTVIYFDGTGANYRSFLGEKVAERMAREGLAVISIDPLLAGIRGPSVPSPELTFINLQNLPAARDNVRQGAADGFTLTRLVAGLAIADGERTHSFDAGRLYFIGHSQGGLTGVAFLAFAPEIKGAVLSGTGGHLTLLVLNKTRPADVAGLLALFIRDTPLDEFNNILGLVQAFAEGGDNTNYAPLLVRSPPPGVPPKDIFQSDGVLDGYIPSVGIEAVAVAAGLSPVLPVLRPVPGFALRALDPVSAPVSGNLGGRTAVFLQYPQRQGSDGHFVFYDIEDARRQADGFISSLARTGTASLPP